MIPTGTHSLRLLTILGLAALCGPLAAQPGTPAPPGLVEEEMWFAPTAEDWKKPCLIKWQRTWEDAQAVAKETGRQLLVCVNMDGEIASEHYAGVRYRQPEIAKLYEPYVCVIASVYRHSPRDHDETGRRILCPRFGSVTCGEHIAIEPKLYAGYFEGKRISPRHIGVGLDGKETYDVYHMWDTDSVFAAVKDGVTKAPPPRTDVVRSDRPAVERVAGRDLSDRIAVESAYQEGDGAAKRALLEAALQQPDAASVDLLRLAVFGVDPELAKVARQALTRSKSEAAVEVIAEALRVPMERSERDALVGALSRYGEASPRARTLAAVHQGLSSRSEAIDVEGWSQALEDAPAGGHASRSSPIRDVLAAQAGPPAAALDEKTVDERVANRAGLLASPDATAKLDLAEALIERALRPGTEAAFAEHLLSDARTVALAAEKGGAYGWRASAAVAVAAFHLGLMDEAHERAEAAVRGLPANPRSWNAMVVLGLFADARQAAIKKAVREKKDWPRQWVADVNAAYEILARHPLGTAEQVATHYDFLMSLGALGPGQRVLDSGLGRFPASGQLHNRLRCRILAEKGVAGLESAYEEKLRQEGASPDIEWFAGYASMLAAEYHRRGRRVAEALAAYDRSIAHFEKSIEGNPDSRQTAEDCIALAFAGRARIAYERKEDDKAVDDIVASFQRRPEGASRQDGLNISPVDTAKMLLSRLKQDQKQELVAKLQAALSKLDPKQLELPAYEREGDGRGQRPRRERP